MAPEAESDQFTYHCPDCGAPLPKGSGVNGVYECHFCYSTVTRPIKRKALSIGDEDNKPAVSAPKPASATSPKPAVSAPKPASATKPKPAAVAPPKKEPTPPAIPSTSVNQSKTLPIEEKKILVESKGTAKPAKATKASKPPKATMAPKPAKVAKSATKKTTGKKK